MARARCSPATRPARRAGAVTGTSPNAAGVVKRGQSLGTSGKTGNASAAGILAHLHFEAALHPTQLAALSVSHALGSDGANQSLWAWSAEYLATVAVRVTSHGPMDPTRL